MGALTNKNFPFELRGWEIEKTSFFDPTDSFGNNLKVLINNNKILQIEPDLSNGYGKNLFISNKSRHFFNIIKNFKNKLVSLNFFQKIILSLKKSLYLFEFNRLKVENIHFFFIIYENLGFDVLCLLTVLKQKYFFIKIQAIDKKIFYNNLESNFLFNKLNLIKSNFCLLLNTNLKFDSVNLNLKLKQRILKGNFQLAGIGTFLNSYFLLQILGSTSNILKFLIEGLHVYCQNIKFEKNPLLIIHSNLLKRHDHNFFILFLTILMNSVKYLNINVLNKSIYETSIYNINNFTNNTKLFFQYSSIYFLNLLNFKNNMFFRVLNINSLYLTKSNNILLIKKYYFKQGNSFVLNKLFKIKNHFYLPVKTFFETTELFFNNEGLIKNSLPLFFNNQLKSNWKLLRYFFNKLNNELTFFKTAFLINFNFNSRYFFIKTIFLIYLAKKIISINFILNNVNSFYIDFDKTVFILKTVKLLNTKFKPLLNDFFIDGQDGYSQHSQIMIKCSNITRLQQTNFF